MRYLIVLLLLGFASNLWAGGGSGPKFAEGVNYIDVTPPLIVNYGGAGKMRYIKAEISIRTEDMAGATEITHHLPLIRDTLISILSVQTEESISSAEGKETLRLFALKEINKVLHRVEKGPEAEHDEEVADKKNKDKKSIKDKPKKDEKKSSSKDKKEKDKKSKDKESDEEAKAEVEAHQKDEDSGPASDLFFNNFVVQK